MRGALSTPPLSLILCKKSMALMILVEQFSRREYGVKEGNLDRRLL